MPVGPLLDIDIFYIQSGYRIYLYSTDPTPTSCTSVDIGTYVTSQDPRTFVILR